MFRRILVRIFFGLLLAGTMALILFFGIISFGFVEGEEFAPDTFQRRTYSYYELPLVQLKITPITRRVSQYQLEQTLVNGSYIIPREPPKRWDLIIARRAGQSWRQGDALILSHYLDAWDANNNMTSYWETWTANHPALAKVLWPEVASLARQDLYFLIPPLFDQALATDNPQMLQNDLNLLLARSYEELAETQGELQDLATAIVFYTEALRHEPARASSLQGRARCYEALGRTEEAARERPIVTHAEAPEEAKHDHHDYQP